MRPRSLCAAVLAAIGAITPAACDQLHNATPSAAGPAASERSNEPLVEGETCTRTDDCPRGARCFDGHCQPSVRSYQGEVLTERGARALANNRFQEAADTYRAAERAYHDRQLPVPASVACGLARALTAVNDRGGTPDDQREATARALAACQVAAPIGSVWADQAVAGLAAMAERGLDPAALDHQGATLMTGRDPRPTADSTHVRLVFTGPAQGTRGTFRELITGDAVRREVVRCFLQWWPSSHQNEDQGTLSVSYSRSRNDYDELSAPSLRVTAADLATPATDAGVPTHWLPCAASAIQTAAASLRWPAQPDRWSETAVITIGQ